LILAGEWNLLQLFCNAHNTNINNWAVNFWYDQKSKWADFV